MTTALPHFALPPHTLRAHARLPQTVEALPQPDAEPTPRLTAVPPLPDAAAGGADDVPDPSPGFLRALAVQGYEVLAGTRTTAQLGPLISAGLARRLTVMRALRGDRRTVYRDHRRATPRPETVRIDRPAPGVAEAAVVLRVGAQARAVAIRLEWAHRHWRATELVVL